MWKHSKHNGDADIVMWMLGKRGSGVSKGAPGVRGHSPANASNGGHLRSRLLQAHATQLAHQGLIDFLEEVRRQCSDQLICRLLRPQQCSATVLMCSTATSLTRLRAKAARQGAGGTLFAKMRVARPTAAFLAVLNVPSNTVSISSVMWEVNLSPLGYMPTYLEGGTAQRLAETLTTGAGKCAFCCQHKLAGSAKTRL